MFSGSMLRKKKVPGHARGGRFPCMPGGIIAPNYLITNGSCAPLWVRVDFSWDLPASAGERSPRALRADHCLRWQVGKSVEYMVDYSPDVAHWDWKLGPENSA